jgi:hypothetical protein
LYSLVLLARRSRAFLFNDKESRVIHSTFMAPPTPLPDITVYSPDARQALVVEIRPTVASDPDHLELVRRALMEDIASKNAQFFLLAQRNGLFLWRGGAGSSRKAEIASVRSVLRDYARSLQNREELLRKPGLELIIFRLDDLAFGIRRPKADAEADE